MNTKKRFIAFIRLFELDTAANITSPAKVIASEASMTALLSLHWIITSQEKSIWTKNNIFLVFAVKGRDA